MNAGLAVYGHYAYVGSRTDGSHVDAGVLVVTAPAPRNRRDLSKGRLEGNPGQLTEN
jgi:hypothetical protein